MKHSTVNGARSVVHHAARLKLQDDLFTGRVRARARQHRILRDTSLHPREATDSGTAPVKAEAEPFWSFHDAPASIFEALTCLV